MDKTSLIAVSRRFPLLGRPRPECPPLEERVAHIARIAQSARRNPADASALSTDALNRAALVASDCGLTDFARDLCWQQINVFRDVGPALSVSEAGYMLAPVLNLARLDIRNGESDEAVDLLGRMLQAVKDRADLDVEGRTLQLSKTVGPREDRKKLHEWAWKSCIADGVRALAAQARWDEAVEHAARHRGIGRHLMDGRQASVVALCLGGRGATAAELLEASDLTQPWERQVARCLAMLCSQSVGEATSADAEAMANEFLEQQPLPGYAPYWARLGTTVVTLAAETHPQAARRALSRTVEDALKSADGYAAREVLSLDTVSICVEDADRDALMGLAASSGLGTGPLAEPLLDSLLVSVNVAEEVLAATIGDYRG